MGKHLRILLFNVFSIIIVLAVPEIISRLILKHIYNRDFDSSLIVDNKYFNSAGLKTNAHGIVWGKDFNTDSFGCRKSAKTYNSKKKKWLFIGDSVTEGVGVDDSSTFASKVAAKTDAFNILNYSLIGYSDADYLNVLKTVLNQNDSSVNRVTIFFCLNDVYGKSKVHDLPAMGKQNWRGKVNGILQSRCATYKLLKLLAYQNSSRYFQYDLALYNKEGKQFNESMEILKQCDLVCKAASVNMNVVMLPYKSQLQGKYAAVKLPQQLVNGFCTSNNIAFEEPLETLQKENQVNSLYLFADEIHFSPQGHNTIASFIVSH